MNAIEIKGLTKNFRMCGQRLESGSKRLDVSLISAYGEISMVAAMLLYMTALWKSIILT